MQTVEMELNEFGDGTIGLHKVIVSRGFDSEKAVVIEWLSSDHSIQATIEEWQAIKEAVDHAIAFLYPTPQEQSNE